MVPQYTGLYSNYMYRSPSKEIHNEYFVVRVQFIVIMAKDGSKCRIA
jgi:hypothetical protein